MSTGLISPFNPKMKVQNDPPFRRDTYNFRYDPMGNESAPVFHQYMLEHPNELLNVYTSPSINYAKPLMTLSYNHSIVKMIIDTDIDMINNRAIPYALEFMIGDSVADRCLIRYVTENEISGADDNTIVGVEILAYRGRREPCFSKNRRALILFRGHCIPRIFLGTSVINESSLYADFVYDKTYNTKFNESTTWYYLYHKWGEQLFNTELMCLDMILPESDIPSQNYYGVYVVPATVGNIRRVVRECCGIKVDDPSIGVRYSWEFEEPVTFERIPIYM